MPEELPEELKADAAGFIAALPASVVMPAGTGKTHLLAAAAKPNRRRQRARPGDHPHQCGRLRRRQPPEAVRGRRATSTSRPSPASRSVSPAPTRYSASASFRRSWFRTTHTLTSARPRSHGRRAHPGSPDSLVHARPRRRVPGLQHRPAPMVLRIKARSTRWESSVTTSRRSSASATRSPAGRRSSRTSLNTLTSSRNRTAGRGTTRNSAPGSSRSAIISSPAGSCS